MDLLRCVAHLRAMDEMTRTIDVVASTESLDSHGTIVEAKWDLSRFAANPVVLWAHNAGLGTPEPPIGYASDVNVVNGELRAKVTFVSAEASQLAERVWQGVKQKSIRGLSVGFRSGGQRVEKRAVGGVEKDVVVLTNNSLYEISFVPVPSNSDALAQVRSRALAAASASHHHDVVDHEPEKGNEDSMSLSNIFRALGLTDNSTEADALARIAQNDGQRRTVEVRAQGFEELTGKTGAEAVGVVRGWKDEAARVGALVAQNAELEGQVRKIEVDKALDEKIRGGFIAPAEREQLAAIGMKDVGMLRGYLGTRTTPIIKVDAPAPNLLPAGNEGTPAGMLSDVERAVAKASGLSEEQALANKKEFALAEPRMPRA